MAATFDGWAMALPSEHAWQREALAAPRATMPATSWLLRLGWRRGGLIRIDEAPAA